MEILKVSRTEVNQMSAFAGKLQACGKYAYFASGARGVRCKSSLSAFSGMILGKGRKSPERMN